MIVGAGMEVRVEEADARVSCPECGKEMAVSALGGHRSRSALARHPDRCSFTPDHDFVCADCGMAFGSKTGLTLHHQFFRCPSHPDARTLLPCAHCAIPWPRPLLQGHEAKCAAALVSCDDCGVTFHTRHAFLCHFKAKDNPCGRRRLSQTGTLSCLQCEKEIRESGMDTHLITCCYQRDSVFRCDYCGQKKGGRVSLMKHQMESCYRRRQALPHRAPILDKLSAPCPKCSTVILKALLATHLGNCGRTGSRRYGCGHCGSTFPLQAHLDMHNKMRHALKNGSNLPSKTPKPQMTKLPPSARKNLNVTFTSITPELHRLLATPGTQNQEPLWSESEDEPWSESEAEEEKSEVESGDIPQCPNCDDSFQDPEELTLHLEICES